MTESPEKQRKDSHLRRVGRNTKISRNNADWDVLKVEALLMTKIFW